MKDWPSYVMLLTVLLVSKCTCFLFLFFFLLRFLIKAVEPSVLVHVANWLDRRAHLHRYWPDNVEDNHSNSLLHRIRSFPVRCSYRVLSVNSSQHAAKKKKVLPYVLILYITHISYMFQSTRCHHRGANIKYCIKINKLYFLHN